MAGVPSLGTGDASRYEGSSAFLRWWPRLLTLFAVLLGLVSLSQPGAIQWATLFAALAVLHALWLRGGSSWVMRACS